MKRNILFFVSCCLIVAGVTLSGCGGGGGSSATPPPPPPPPPPLSGPPLSGLAVSAGTMAPAFASSTINYTLLSLGTATSVAVTPTTAVTATITVNGTTVASGATSTAFPLSLGANTITTVVTDTSGTRTYTIATTLSGSSSTTFASAPTMSNRMFRDGTATGCTGTANVFPTPNIAGTVGYKTYSFHHTGPSACVSVVLINDPACYLNVFASAYAGSFDPASLGTNYLGDAGASNLTEAFSFPVPANSDYVVVVNTIGGVTGCSYVFTVRE